MGVISTSRQWCRTKVTGHLPALVCTKAKCLLNYNGRRPGPGHAQVGAGECGVQLCFLSSFPRNQKDHQTDLFSSLYPREKGVQEIVCFGMNFWCVLFVFCIHTKYRGKLLINVNEWDLH